MPPELLREVRQWQRKAEIDLGAARALLAGERSFPSVAVFLCQQSGEETLKAYLVAIAVARIAERLDHQVGMTVARPVLEPEPELRCPRLVQVVRAVGRDAGEELVVLERQVQAKHVQLDGLALPQVGVVLVRRTPEDQLQRAVAVEVHQPCVLRLRVAMALDRRLRHLHQLERLRRDASRAVQPGLEQRDVQPVRHAVAGRRHRGDALPDLLDDPRRRAVLVEPVGAGVFRRLRAVARLRHARGVLLPGSRDKFVR